MKKKVSELSMDEFKKAFPILVKEHNESYRDWYESETKNICSVIRAEDIIRINHIGSTAVKGLLAKPTIDILMEIDGCCNVTRMLDDLKAIGFGEEIFTRNEDPLRILLGKGYSSDGCAEKVFHLHIRYAGDWDELYFRDYLMQYPAVAQEYGQLKLSILQGIEKGEIERMPNGKANGYSTAKLDFVKKYSLIAKQEFQNRYKPV